MSAVLDYLKQGLVTRKNRLKELEQIIQANYHGDLVRLYAKVAGWNETNEVTRNRMYNAMKEHKYLEKMIKIQESEETHEEILRLHLEINEFLRTINLMEM
jgi:hypothetical protein